ncbi:MAG: hypothetical protein HY564_02655 [Candidatus Jacksonbacteria bacterium]|nr:hypothetical protein [Candidatus Jacksonbacteria bacterium]
MKQTKEQKIVQEFIKFGKLVKGGDFYFPSKYAKRFIERSREEDSAILGIEGFLVHQDTGAMEAKLDWIADYSPSFVPASHWEEYVKICYAKAEQFLNELPKNQNIWVNFVLFEKKQWEQARKS